MDTTLRVLALVLSGAAFLLAAAPFVRVRSPATLWLLPLDFLGTAWAPYVAVAGTAGAVLGVLSACPLAIGAGGIAAVLAADYVRRVTARHDGLDRAFGPGWRSRLAPEAEGRMLRHRWGWRAPRAPEARCTRDVVLSIDPGTDRALLGDVWQPPEGVAPSGTAVVYLHGSAWYLLDKDVGTRRMFRHLAAQGHVVVDVAYRLCPETDFRGMVADAMHAVAWTKAHAAGWGARPDRVVLAGASAGAHVALVAAFAPGHAQLTPADLHDVDVSVRGVVSWYGIPDMRAFDERARPYMQPHELAGPVPPRAPPPGRFGRWLWRKAFGRDLPLHLLPPPPPHRRIMTDLLGGMPDEAPEAFDLASPTHHVGPHCPPTLLLVGTNDQIVPLEATRRLARALEAAGVPVVLVEYPRTGHAFDLIPTPLVSPAGQSALHDVDRFLACVALPRGEEEARQPRRAAPYLSTSESRGFAR